MISTAFSSLSAIGWALSMAALVLAGLAISWLSSALARRAAMTPRRMVPSVVTLPALLV